MDVTVFSFVMAVLWSSIFILAIYFLRRKPHFAGVFGISSIVILYLFSAFRVLVPVELQFSKVIRTPVLYNTLYKVVCLKPVEVKSVQFRIMDLLIVIWLAVAVILTFRLIFSYLMCMRQLSGYRESDDDRISSILRYIKEETGIRFQIRVIQDPKIEIPMGIGIFKKTILLPDMDFSSRDLYFILLHECTHLKNNDIAVKMLTHIYCCIFWWNPVVCFLKKDLEQTLEIKCDLTVTERMVNEVKSEYLSAIVRTLKRTEASSAGVPAINTPLFQMNGSMLVERFHYVSYASHSTGKKKALTAVCCIILFFSMPLSYIPVFQPFYEPNDKDVVNKQNILEITPDNYVIVEGENDNYILMGADGNKININESVMKQLLNDGITYVQED